LLDEEEFELEGPSGGLLDGALGLLEAGFEFCGVLDPGSLKISGLIVMSNGAAEFLYERATLFFFKGLAVGLGGR